MNRHEDAEYRRRLAARAARQTEIDEARGFTKVGATPTSNRPPSRRRPRKNQARYKRTYRCWWCSEPHQRKGRLCKTCAPHYQRLAALAREAQTG
jgi:hypothetical protein